MTPYENYRIDLLSALGDKLPPEQLQKVFNAIDQISINYDFSKKETSLIVPTGLPNAAKAFIAAKAVKNASIGTINQYRYKLINFFHDVGKDYAEITSEDIYKYLFNCKNQNNNSDATIDNTRRVLNSFFSWLVLNEYIHKNPCANVEKVKYEYKQRVFLTSYELEVFRWNCKDIREKAMVDFIFSTGCRVSEFVALLKSDINWENRSAKIRHGKGDKPRIVFFNAESELTLRKYLESRTDNDEHLFVSTRKPHHGMKTESIQASFRKIRSRIENAQTITPHVLRHTFATTGIRNGVPLEQLQALMGHSKPETTLIYAKVDTTDLQRIHQRVYS